MSDEDRAFLRAIVANPAEVTAWLAYVDWLDEHGESVRAEFVRLQARLAADVSPEDRYGILGELEDLRPALDADWVAIFERPYIENCDERFAFKCPRKWEQLTGTDDTNVRHCSACRRNVYYCHTIQEAQDHARQGDCVAVSEDAERWPGDLKYPFGPPAERLTMGIMIP
ncbi:MAG: TIGR02996 domain-containing protein, partial [Gemmataceae bacterium]|nr:TIGR02996 domain-containing protein [Gemmataceae bacterium]